MAERRKLPEISKSTGERVLGLDFAKYLLSGDKRRHIAMESDNTTGTESDLSDWEVGRRYITSENSEESDDYGIYYDGDQPGTLSMFDTVIGGGDDQYGRNREQIQQVNSILAHMNSSNADSGYSGSLYPIHETGSTMTDSSGSHDNNSEGTLSNSGSPIHHPVYGSYHKIQNQIDEARRMEGDGTQERLMLHRLPGEYLGMILGIEGGKEGNGTVTSVCVKSVTLGGAAHRATGGSKGMCVGDEIIEVNGLDLHTLTHDECVQVFKDMPLRVMLGIRRGEKNIPPVAISPLPMEKEKLIQRQNSNPQQTSPRFITPQQMSDSDEDGFAGFAIYQVTIEKDPTENLGLSIVPSYGSTKQYYQIKRILPSGTAALSGQLQVGDRLITCNGKNLKDLTQNHCLNIIRTASSYGNVTFEVIRPVYNGSSMEISVTVNPNSQQNNPYAHGYDPQQYSLKSQSYDRHVDVIVTSESEDYLTVSEDEYSKSGRLANIPEVEANEVFASNSVRLAFQKPFSKIEEESTATETEPETLSPRDILTKDGIDIIDLNKGDSSPYHIPKRPLSAGGNLSPRYRSTIPKSDLDNLSPRSQTKHSPRSPQIPKTDIDTISVSSIRSRSPLLKTDLDTVSVTSNRSRSPNLLKTDIDNVSVSSNSPRSSVPQSDLDSLRFQTQSPTSPGRVYTTSPVRQSYNKRQQVPLDTSGSISPPFNYQTDSISKDIPTDTQDSVRYNPLYDSNASEATDSETVQDVYIVSPDSNTDLENDLEYIDDVVEVALPPPIEFSDNQNKEPEDNFGYSPVTNIDDLASSSVEVSPIHQEITVKPSYRKPNNSVVKLEKSFTDLEEASTDKLRDIPRDYTDRELAFNIELTAPFDSVLQEHGECVQRTDSVPVDFTESSDNEILQVVQSYDDGTVVISQFDANDNRESTDSPTNYYTQGRLDTRMDTNSEAMLKDALDMEYEQLPETNKFTTRIELAGDMQPDKVDLGEELANGRNVIAETVAKEMLQNEGGNYGYYMESDDEPDDYPGEDQPEPELPDAPPPFLLQSSKDIGEPIHQTVVAVDGNVTTDTEQSVTTESDMDGYPEQILDSNWSFRARDTNVGKSNENQNEESEIIVPVSVQRKVDIAIDNLKIGQEDEEDVVVPQKVERNFSVPKDFTVRDLALDKELSQKKKKAPPVAPKPAKSGLSPRSPVDENFNSKSFSRETQIDLEPVQEDMFTPVDVSEQRKKNLVNVISVVNALKAAKAHEEPDVVDLVVKVDKKDLFKKSVGAFINAGNGSNKQDSVQANKNTVNIKVNGQMSPPKNDVFVSSKQEITMSTPVSKKALDKPNTDRETSPPKQEVIVTTKQEIVQTKPVPKPRETVQDKNQNNESLSNIKDNVNEKINTIPVMKTSIMVEKQPRSEEKPTSPIDTNAPGQTSNITVPPLNLTPLTSSNSDSLSPKSDKSGETSPSSTYKTTIGVTQSKPGKVSPTMENMPVKMEDKISPKSAEKTKESGTKGPQFKTLTAIKPLSFNPKSLSQTLPARSVQYKTTVNTVGLKPATGLSSLGRSSLLGTQKTDMPIKRMESMPFEVSILKGILGIGIKTTMTPEGFVKISEILPSGPVGREGNIKVGDYLLSINGTQLTGLPDTKVQQTLRLLPRGLSKLVASAVPPDPNTVTASPVEKSKLTAQQSAPLSTLRKTTVTTKPEPLTISTRKPVINTKSLSSALSPRNKDTTSPLVSPRSKAPPSTLPKPKERTSPRNEMSCKSPVSERLVSPVTSPRQQSALSPRSPKSPPPPVAPKPARKPSGDKVPNEDPNQPIETVILASVNSSKVESTKPGPNLLPGSVNYDSTEPLKVTAGKGEVSSAGFKSPSVLGNASEGKVDIVNDTDAHINIELTNNSPDSISDQLSQRNDAKDVKESTEVKDVTGTKDRAEADLFLESIVKDVSEKPEVDVSLLANRNRSFSTSSDNESYTDFNECGVEETEIPDEIVEVDETEAEHPDAVRSPINDTNVKSDEYESDFEDTPDQIEKDESKDKTKMDALTDMAERIVSKVISNVQQMDLSKETPMKVSPLPIVVENSQSVESAPTLPSEAPPLPSEAPPLPSEAPPLPSEAPPPIPEIAPPPLSSDNQIQQEESSVRQVDDMSLYPDDIPTENNVTDKKRDSDQVIDVVSSYHSAQLHAEKPLLNAGGAHVIATPDSNEIDSISKQVSVSSRDPSDRTDDVGYDKPVDDSSVNIVIDMYSDIGNVIAKTNEQTNPPDVVNKEQDETESFEGKSISSSDDVLSDVDNNPDIVKDTVASDTNVKDTEVTDTKVKDTEFSDTNEVKNVNNKDAVKEKPLNGHSSHTGDRRRERALSPIDTQKGREGSTSLSPRSDSTYSPRTADSVTSEEERHSRYIPDVDKVIRMLSQSEEPIDKGEGEIIMITINKGVTGLGFVIEGGKLSVKGDLPISIKRIFKGGPADSLLQIGDEICEVNGEDISQMRRTEAWNHLKFIPSGDIEMKIRRFKKGEPVETVV